MRDCITSVVIDSHLVTTERATLGMKQQHEGRIKVERLWRTLGQLCPKVQLKSRFLGYMC